MKESSWGHRPNVGTLECSCRGRCPTPTAYPIRVASFYFCISGHVLPTPELSLTNRQLRLPISPTSRRRRYHCLSARDMEPLQRVMSHFEIQVKSAKTTEISWYIYHRTGWCSYAVGYSVEVRTIGPPLLKRLTSSHQYFFLAKTGVESSFHTQGSSEAQSSARFSHTEPFWK